LDAEFYGGGVAQNGVNVFINFVLFSFAESGVYTFPM